MFCATRLPGSNSWKWHIVRRWDTERRPLHSFPQFPTTPPQQEPPLRRPPADIPEGTRRNTDTGTYILIPAQHRCFCRDTAHKSTGRGAVLILSPTPLRPGNQGDLQAVTTAPHDAVPEAACICYRRLTRGTPTGMPAPTSTLRMILAGPFRELCPHQFCPSAQPEQTRSGS